jgi:hypothetical protein
MAIHPLSLGWARPSGGLSGFSNKIRAPEAALFSGKRKTSNLK